MSKIIYVKPGTKNVFGILGVKIKARKLRKVRKVKRERLPTHERRNTIYTIEEWVIHLEELKKGKRQRRPFVYKPPKPKKPSTG